MLITSLMFIFSNFFSFIFFGQMWSQNLKFSKLTEIRFRGTLLYAYYDLMFIFPKFLSLLFLGKYGSIIGFLQIDLNLLEGYIAICLLQF